MNFGMEAVVTLDERSTVHPGTGSEADDRGKQFALHGSRTGTVAQRLRLLAVPDERASRRPRIAICLVVIAAILVGGGVMTIATSIGVSGPLPGEEVPITAMNTLKGPANNSPEVVADPTDSRFVVIANRLDAPDFSCALQVSGDGGDAWLTATPVPHLPSGVEKCYAPEVAFDRTGLLYYLFVGLHGGGNLPLGVYLSTSRDHGRTFSPPRLVLGPDNFAVRMSIDRTEGPSGRIQLLWLHAGAPPLLGGLPPGVNPILIAHSDDGGRSFSEPVQVSDPARQLVVGPALILGANHSVYVAYFDLEGDNRDYEGLEGPVWDGHWTVVVTKSTDGGAHFGPSVVVDDGVVPSERVMLIFTMPPPSLATSGKRICAAWTDARYGDPDVLARCSSDAGRQWQVVSRVNDDPLGDGHSQYLPALAFAPDGRLDAVFFDRRNDPINANNNVTYTYSTDLGRHWARNIELAHEVSPAIIGPQYAGPAAAGQHELGSRLGILSESHMVLVAWPDTRNSLDSATAEDLFVDQVRLRGHHYWGEGLGVGLLLTAGICVLLAIRNVRRVSLPWSPLVDVKKESPPE
jgi:hypothetical protein